MQPEQPNLQSGQNNLEYVKQILQASRGPNSYPSIYFLWGCLIFTGYAIAEFKLEWTNTYWLITAPAGMLISAWLGARGDKRQGQLDGQIGDQYLYHFGILLIFVFMAIFTDQYRSILLLIGLAYGLAGIYLERLMLVVSLLSGLIYLGIYFGFITSNLLVGGLFALGFFATAWGAAKMNADATHKV